LNALVIFDSDYGNTKLIAETIASQLKAKAVSVKDIKDSEIKKANLIVVGSPIHGWRPSEAMVEFISILDSKQLVGKKAATFDTRIKLFIHGDAMLKIAEGLSAAGAEIVGSQPFYVKGKVSTLLDGEIDRAVEWAEQLTKTQ